MGKRRNRQPTTAAPLPKGKHAEVLRKLGEFESLTWPQLCTRNGGKSHHAIEIARLSPKAKKRLQALNQDDVAYVHSIRIDGKRRVIGVLHDFCFYLLWWDPEHEVCQSRKKHT